MKFGYFTLSDNHYRDNARQPNAFVADIIGEAVYADTLGMHSAWIGELHFSTLITAALKRVETAGFDEVILYFNVDVKPHAQVKDEMARFAEQVAPAFDRR